MYNELETYRAWSEQEQKMLDHEELNDIGGFFYNSFIGLSHSFERGFKLMQCTGVRDKNGVFIFVGDIIQLDNGQYRTVTHRAGGFVFEMFADEIGQDKLTGAEPMASYQNISYCNSCVSVVGNIYQNKDLLNDNRHT